MEIESIGWWNVKSSWPIFAPKLGGKREAAV
jgi:hypothetical protein